MGTVRMVNSQGQVRYFTESVANHAITKRNGWYRQELEPVESIPDVIQTTWQKAKDSIGYIEPSQASDGEIQPHEMFPGYGVETTISPAAQEAKTYIEAAPVVPATPKPKRTRSTSGKKRTRKPAEKKK